MDIEGWHVMAIILNIFVSMYIIYLCDGLNRFQKISQIIIIWLIPFVGAIGIFLLNMSFNDESGPPSSGTGGGSGLHSSEFGSGGSGGMP